MKRVAQELLDKDNAQSEQEALRIYGTLFEAVFSSDNYLFNGDIIDTYYKLLLKNQKYAESMGVKKRLIKYLKDEKTIDH